MVIRRHKVDCGVVRVVRKSDSLQGDEKNIVIRYRRGVIIITTFKGDR